MLGHSSPTRERATIIAIVGVVMVGIAVVLESTGVRLGTWWGLLSVGLIGVGLLVADRQRKKRQPDQP